MDESKQRLHNHVMSGPHYVPRPQPKPEEEALWNLDAKTLGQRLVNARSYRELSQADVAKKIGVSRAAVSQWETGSTRPDLQRLEAVANIYQLPLEWIVMGDMKYLLKDSEAYKPLFDGRLEAEMQDVFSCPLIAIEDVGEWHGTPYDFRKKLERPYRLTSNLGDLQGKGGAWLDPRNCCITNVPDNSLSPSFLPGDLVTVWHSDEAQISPGDFIVVLPGLGLKPIIRRLKVLQSSANGEPEVIDLVPANTDWPTLRVDDVSGITIIGPLIEMRRMLREGKPQR